MLSGWKHVEYLLYAGPVYVALLAILKWEKVELQLLPSALIFRATAGKKYMRF